MHSELPEENPSATAIRFFPSLVKGNYALIVGLESGDLLLWNYDSLAKVWSKLYQVNQYLTHCATVRRIKFNLRYSKPEQEEYVVASCGADHSVRLL